MKKIIPLMIFLLMASCTGEMDGTISVKGNEPHTFLAFTAPNGNMYRIEGSNVNELRSKYQGTRVRIKGKLIKETESSGFESGVIEVNEIVKVYTD